MDDIDDPDLAEHHHSRHYRKTKKKKHTTPKKRSHNKTLPFRLKLFIMLLIILAMLISTSSYITTSEPTVTIEYITTPPLPVSTETRIPDSEREDNEKKLEKEDESIEEKIWQNRPGAIVNK